MSCISVLVYLWTNTLTYWHVFMCLRTYILPVDVYGLRTCIVALHLPVFHLSVFVWLSCPGERAKQFDYLKRSTRCGFLRAADWSSVGCGYVWVVAGGFICRLLVLHLSWGVGVFSISVTKYNIEGFRVEGLGLDTSHKGVEVVRVTSRGGTGPSNMSILTTKVVILL